MKGRKEYEIVKVKGRSDEESSPASASPRTSEVKRARESKRDTMKSSPEKRHKQSNN
jgi:hypothetical protein